MLPMTEVNSSGAELPAAMKVAPATSSLRSRRWRERERERERERGREENKYIYKTEKERMGKRENAKHVYPNQCQHNSTSTECHTVQREHI